VKRERQTSAQLIER